jgi:putative copper export protein/methionine-rich copper-binding protein CopC
VKARSRNAFVTLVLIFVLAAIPGLLLAHGALKKSDPAENATLVVAPGAIRLTFTEPAELAVGRIELTGPDGQAVALSTVRHGDSATVMVADILGSLQPGRYIVAWQVAGRDGHPVRGAYGFLIAEGATGLDRPDQSGQGASDATPPPQTAAKSLEEHASHGAPSVGAFDAESPLYAAIRWLGFIGLLGLVGAVSFGRLVIPGALRRQAPSEWATEARVQLRRAALAALGVLFLALLLRLAAQSVAIHGSIAALDGSLLTATLWGKAWLAQLLGLALATAALLPTRETAGTTWMLTIAIMVVAASFALSGHAAAVPENMAFAIPIDTLHILGAGGWIGTLLLVVTVGLPAIIRSGAADRGRTVAILINTFSPFALIFAGLAALTGLVSAWTQLGAVDALWTTRYGRVLLVKLALVAMVMGAGAYNAYRVRPALGSETSGVRIQRSATVELLIAALVLAATAVLVATPTGTVSS